MPACANGRQKRKGEERLGETKETVPVEVQEIAGIYKKTIKGKIK